MLILCLGLQMGTRQPDRENLAAANARYFGRNEATGGEILQRRTDEAYTELPTQVSNLQYP